MNEISELRPYINSLTPPDLAFIGITKIFGTDEFCVSVRGGGGPLRIIRNTDLLPGCKINLTLASHNKAIFQITPHPEKVLILTPF